MERKLIVISAPSGAGKTTIVRRMLELVPALEFSVSACSRPKRNGEINGKDYYFLGTEEFREKIRKNEFLEWEQVYEGQYYGTLVAEVERIWKKGMHVIFDVDVKGGLSIKKRFPERTLAIFIRPPSFEVLEERLRNRSTESPENLRKRLEKARYELDFARQFDRVVVNNDLDTAIKQVHSIILEFLDEGDTHERDQQ